MREDRSQFRRETALRPTAPLAPSDGLSTMCCEDFSDPLSSHASASATKSRCRFSSGRWWGIALAGLIAFAGTSESLHAAETEDSPGTLRGLPFTRSYPLEEIGNVPRGARLNFDRFGRLAVVYDGIYAVLNDTTWLDIADKSSGAGLPMVAQGDDGRAYYAGYGTWGTVEVTTNGKLRPHSVVPPDAPRWALTMGFNDIEVTEHGIFFGGWSGVVYWDSATQQNHFFEILGFNKLFRTGENVYVSAFRQPIQRIDVRDSTVRPVEGTLFGEDAIATATSLDETQTLVGTREGHLLLFDGEHLTPWSGQSRNDLRGRVTSLQRLLDGGVAVAISGRGLFLATEEGELISAFTSPEYHQITQLATREPGVLWAAGEDGIRKLLYGSPLTIFGQRLGITPSWPTVVRWNNKIVVCSSGRLFSAVPGTAGSAGRFEPMPNQPAAGGWTLAANGPHLLVGNGKGAYVAQSDGTYITAIPDMDVARLAMVGPDRCFAIGRQEIAVLGWKDGRWTEIAPRIPSVGYPSVVHSTNYAVWIEFGSQRVARLSLKDGAIKAQVFEDFPCKDAHWIKIGTIDRTVIFTGPRGYRKYFD